MGREFITLSSSRSPDRYVAYLYPVPPARTFENRHQVRLADRDVYKLG